MRKTWRYQKTLDQAETKLNTCQKQNRHLNFRGLVHQPHDVRHAVRGDEAEMYWIASLFSNRFHLSETYP